MSDYIYGSLIDAMAHCIGLDCIDEKRTFFKATKNILWTANGNEKLDWLYEAQSKEHPLIGRIIADETGAKTYSLYDIGIEFLTCYTHLDYIITCHNKKICSQHYKADKDYKAFRNAYEKLENSTKRRKSKREGCKDCPFFWNDSYEYQEYGCHLFGDDVSEWAVRATDWGSTCNIASNSLTRLYALYMKMRDHEYDYCQNMWLEDKYQERFKEDVLGRVIEKTEGDSEK